MISKRSLLSIGVFFLLYYIYMNSIRRLMIPMSNITIPLILAIVLGITLWGTKGKITVRSNSDKIQCYTWILIAVYITLNNEAFLSSLIGGGMIQLYVMICFMLFVTRSDDWINSWTKWTEVFVIIHALATITFFLNSGLYSQFVSFFFSSSYSTMMYYYKIGWMCGLCSHFSSNGMVLATGLAFLFERIRFLRQKTRTGQMNKALHIRYLGFLCVLYALFLSSKRGPLISVFLAIVITYIFAQGKNVAKRLLILTIACIAALFAYMILLQLVPGLNTIANKFNSLEDSDAGILNGRSGLWERAIYMFNRNPLFGGGFGSYSIYATATNAITTSAHNYYLQIMAELGIVGLVPYILAFISGVVNTLIELKKAILSGDKRNAMILNIALEVQLFVILYSMTSTSMMYYPILIPYFLACTATRSIKFNLPHTQEE